MGSCPARRRGGAVDAEVIEQNEANNVFTRSDALVVKPVSSSDLVSAPVAWTPSSASAGDNARYTVAIKNQGTVASASGARNVTLTVGLQRRHRQDAHRLLQRRHRVRRRTAPVGLGSWTAANGKCTVKAVIADDADELRVEQADNTTTQALFVGRGADMPYDMYEAEDGTVGGGAKVVGPNRTIGDIAGEASGRKAVTLTGTGQYVEWTTRAATNTLVTRWRIPDGTDTTLNVYVDGQFLDGNEPHVEVRLRYGNETSPVARGSGAPRHVDEANLQLGRTVDRPDPPPERPRPTLPPTQSTSSTSNRRRRSQNPDPAAYTVPAGFSHQDVQNALDKVRMDTAASSSASARRRLRDLQQVPGLRQGGQGRRES